MTAGSDWYKGEYKSLVGLLQENRKVNKEYQKKNKGFKIAIIVEVAVFALYLLFFIFLGMRNFTRETRNVILILSIGIILIFLLMDIILWYLMIYKPKKDFFKKAESSFPGIDLSSESSMKKYLWTFEGRELLYNLIPIIEWEGGIRNVGGALPNESYTPNERIVLDVWRTNNIDQELYGYYYHGEHVISYLEGVVDSFSKIGAIGEAKIWAEAYHLFEKLERIEDDTINPEPNDTNVRDDINYYIYSYGGAQFAFTEENRVWLADLKKRHEALREDTEKLLYEYVMEHKEELKY